MIAAWVFLHSRPYKCQTWM